MSNIGTSAFGLRLPVIRTGDDICNIILDSLDDTFDSQEWCPRNNDVVGITESILARAMNRYITVDDIVKDLENKFPNCGCVYVYNPIYSRNRFSIILRAIARYFDKVIIVGDNIDEVGNKIEHPITKVNYKELYKDIINQEHSEFDWITKSDFSKRKFNLQIIDCTLHPEFKTESLPSDNKCVTLKDIGNDVSEYGLLGSNKVDEETLKLFPDSKDQHVVDKIKSLYEEMFGVKNVGVMVYGDGCYKDASSGIWEFADPTVSPVYTSNLIGSPSELKLKYLADDEFKDLNGEELTLAVKKRIMEKHVEQGTMETQGTTPRNYTDLLGSLMDLISGSGDKGTPVVVVQGYFKNYTEN